MRDIEIVSSAADKLCWESIRRSYDKFRRSIDSLVEDVGTIYQAGVIGGKNYGLVLDGGKQEIGCL